MIGVGGFLGIGEKIVAIPITNISVAQDPQSGDMKLTTMETAETLKVAPQFKTLAMKQAETSSKVTLPNSGATSTNPATTK